MPNPQRPLRGAIQLTDHDKTAIGQDGLIIEYAGNDTCPYGVDATLAKTDFIGLVIHDNPPGHDIDWYVDYQLQFDPERGGHFGYHFYVSSTGRIVQGAPLDKRTNHVRRDERVRRTFGAAFFNTNSIGITCVGAGVQAGFAPTASQTEAACTLVFALCNYYRIPFLSVVGHGEIETSRAETEGASLARAIRRW